ncbi:CDP-diacylglycerol--glycerol-3-phosphate 3-phosphatidyltransferase [Paracholeplasma manati]|jgi:CDP-diacylglycerol--glycerol-3-phosphate 3-phosphatidyltransferase|uniref:CDP-diacylglycerol--glycerol-3-phosphate 3-phosphatidyltransferase n=1 Tax=Paracholeplasma manati TaxID=591373 RepID=A0ABT2Y5L1_9MOLU|nr:CDP-diacylglycerol--glycerol-3-phosphate 3-phosphatidyltransferase [Paracholeplasma manati]MCV2232025.1 CDP-diacylglycerol--glycerol-3-phosphate 3-phosphatidyltransferase [Paracholeplasma manati]MDG0888821.1 CDP-diacylglycerol--glycerol-3-phosphate 3-phosphatidyltransferase [Paracholeplasma manati]MDX9807192.1 CDP-diacylglycerol--glycerol-3-phosphate 3-phosphatidyltransferase [Acholeplasma sp.]
MTLPNKLTLSRFVAIPVMVIISFLEPLRSVDNVLFGLDFAQLFFAILFVLASFTDFLDGYLARKYNQVTTFGKFTDPIADKLLVLTAFLYLQSMGDRVLWWMTLIVVAREFIVTGVRLLAVEKGKVIAASPFGKLKMVSTVVALVVLLFNDFGLPTVIGDVLLWLALLFTVLSGADYFWKNRHLVFESI